MSPETYKRRMAELGVDRAALETGLPPESRASVRELHEKAYLPGGEKNSLVPLVPVEGQDFSAMNGKAWKVAQRNGRKARMKKL